jgi:hypothetical protein
VEDNAGDSVSFKEYLLVIAREAAVCHENEKRLAVRCALWFPASTGEGNNLTVH